MIKATTLSPIQLKKPQLSTLLGLVLALCMLVICLLFSVTLGAAEIPLVVWQVNNAR